MLSHLSRNLAEPEPKQVGSHQSFSVQSFDGSRIDYDLYDSPSTHPVLVVPGFWRNRKYESMQRLGDFLGGIGLRAAIMDPRGHGTSEGVFGFNRNEHHDVAAVARDILDRTGASGLTLMGFSAGGAIAISCAALHELPISSLLLISPVSNFRRVIPRVNPLTLHRHIALSQALHRPRFEWRFRAAGRDASADIAQVRVPIALIHVKNDWLIDHAHSIDLYQRANEPKELHIIDIPGNYHADRIFNVPGTDVFPIMTSFLTRTAGLK